MEQGADELLARNKAPVSRQLSLSLFITLYPFGRTSLPASFHPLTLYCTSRHNYGFIMLESVSWSA